MKKIAIGLLAVLAAISAYAQDAGKDMAAMANAYNSATALSMEVEVKIHGNGQYSSGVTTQKAKMCKSKDQYYSEYDGHVMINNKQGTLMIDHSSKKMQYYRTPMKFQSKASGDIDFEQFANHADKMEFKGSKNGLLHYTYVEENGVATELYIDSKSFFLKKVVYRYAAVDDEQDYGAEKVEISYTKISTNKVVAKSFDTGKYLKNQGGKPIPQPDYQSYVLTVY